jgi:surface-anchored protein
MKPLIRLLCLLLCCAVVDRSLADPVTVLTTEHTDLLIVHEPGQTPPLRIKARAFSDLEATNVLLTVAQSAKLSIPANPNFAFLGNAGDPVWVLPASQNDNLLYLGFSSDASSPPLSQASTARVVHVSAPGKFFVWQTSGGAANVFINAAPGESGPTNRVTVNNPSHAHYNFGFSTSGVYRVTFRAEAELAAGGLITGTNETFVFHVAPLNAFETWQTNHWSPTAPENIVEAGADPDGDGVENFAEFALGLDPNAAEPALLPQAVIVEIDGQRYGAVRYRRAKAGVDWARIVVETRATADATQGTELTQIVSIVDAGTVDLVTVRDAHPIAVGDQRFYRVSVLPR